VTLALLGGIFIFSFWAGIVHDPHVVYFLPFVNPGIYATVGATMGAFADTLIVVRAGTSNRQRFVIIGFVVSLVIGILQALPQLFAQ
jgi:hypothetical protein